MNAGNSGTSSVTRDGRHEQFGVSSAGGRRLSAHDQAAIVEVVLLDIEKNYGRYITPEDEKRARQQAQRIRKKAIKYGILRD